MENKKIANSQDKLKALRLAEIQMTDKEDFESCVSDLIRNASLGNEEAKIVASAIRSKYLPNILRESGINEMVNLDEGLETEDFAKDTKTDNDMEMHHFESDEEVEDMDHEEMSDDEMMDEDEVDDEDTATFEIEVPADMVDAAKQAIQEALDNLLGEDEDSDVDMESEEDMDVDMDTEDMSDESETKDEDSEATMNKSSNRVNNMTKQALAARRAEREQILKKLASEEEKYPASANFKYNNDMANMPGDVDYPTFKFDGENPLKSDNPSFADLSIPTMNDLTDHAGVSNSKFDGTPSGDLEYTVDWESLENPSEGLEDEMFEVPTEMPMEHNTSSPNPQRVASKHNVECTSCGYRMSLSDDEMESAECPKCHGTGKVDGDDMEDDDDSDKEAVNLKITNPAAIAPGATVTFSSNKLETARIKTAYSCSSNLALAGIIETSEIDSYADQMLNDNLKADAMIRQTKLLLKSAQASSERVAAAAAERMNSVKTASTMGISTSPAFSGSVPVNGAALDIQSALKGTWTMPSIED